MHDFKPLAELLDGRFPGCFSCAPGKSGQASGLTIRCSKRNGYAFVFEPGDNDPSYLLALHESDGDQNPEVWSAKDAAEVVRRVQPWAFPGQWTPPEPVDRAKERARLQKIARGLSARTAVECRTSEPKPALLPLLTDRGKCDFDRDLKSVAAGRVVRHFPWDPAGRLALKTAVLLNVYETIKPPGRDRDLCLAAVGPDRRSDEQVVRIELADLIVVNQTHRWEDCPWLWTLAEPPADLLLGAASAGATPENQQAMESLERLDEGRIENALALYGVTVSDDLRRLLGGERISPPACCAHPDATWRTLLVETLRQSAPWLLPKAVADEAERLRQWAAQKKGRRQRAPSLKLAIFPGQPHSRKASLMLTGEVDGSNPRLVIEATASNARLHERAWKRSIEVDWARYGVEPPTIVPQ